MFSKNKIFSYLLLIVVFLSGQLSAQTILKEKSMILQQQEQYTQNVYEFIDSPITQIEWPTQIDQTSISKPYSVLNTNTASPPLVPLASFTLGQTQKFIIGFSTESTPQNTISLFLNYQVLQIDSTCNCLMQTTVASLQIDTLTSVPLLQYGSFYTSTNGFISYQQDIDTMVSGHFFYNSQTNQIVLTLLKKTILLQHVSILGVNNSSYVIQTVENMYQLIKFDSIQNIVFTKTIKASSCTNTIQILDQRKGYLIYCSATSTFQILTLDYSNETLNVQQLEIGLSNLDFLSITSERIGEKLMIGLGYLSKYYIVTLSFYNNIASNPYSVLSNSTLSYSLTQPTFVTKNILVDIEGSNLKIINLEKEQIVFEQQSVVEKGISINSIKSLGNQLIIYTFTDNHLKYNNSISVAINLPSFVIIGTQQSPITYSLTTIIGVTYNLVITINVVQQNQVIFAQPQVFEQNLIPTFSFNKIIRIPIEEYVIGSDLSQLAITIDEQYLKIVRNMQIQQQFLLDIDKSSTILDKSCVYYQTDAFFSSLVLCQDKNQQYVVYAAIPQVSEFQVGSVNYIQSNISFPSAITSVDNQGSFFTQSVQATAYSIQIPFLTISRYSSTLLFNTVSVFCSQGSFLFASDPQNGVLFTVCNNQLTMYILELYQSNGVAYIVSNTPLTAGIEIIKQIICIQGQLFIYNDQTIVAYDYSTFGFIGSLNIPQLVQGKIQQLTLYKDSFLITVLDNPITQIAQFSFKNFVSSTPKLLRYLQIDKTHQIDPRGIIIPIRQSKEVAYILSAKSNIYYYYRIDSRQWSNQLYTTVSFVASSTVLTSNMIYQFYPNIYTYILPQTSVAYQLGMAQDIFNSNLEWSLQFSLAFPQAITTSNTIARYLSSTKNPIKSDNDNINNNNQIQQYQQFQLVLNRDAQAKYGVVNKNSQSVQILRQQLMTNSTHYNPYNYFDDTGVFNACNVGWATQYNGDALQKIEASRPVQGDTTYSILYQYPLTIKSNSITGFYNLNGNFTGCNILDDSGSQQTEGYSEYSFNLYILCSQTVTQYKGSYSISPTTQKPLPITLANPTKYNFTDKYLISTFRRIVSTNNSIYLFLQNRMVGYKLTLNTESNSATITELDNSFQARRSFNVINQFNLQLIISTSGLIVWQIRSNQQPNVSNISTLLSYFSFRINNGDTIDNVEQYSDNHFRISFSKSYVYDITFGLDQNQQLIIISANQYYYKDAFDYFVSGYKFNNITLLFGTLSGFSDRLNIALYDTSQSKQIYLIQSLTGSSFLKNLEFTPTYGTAQPITNIQIFTSGGQSIMIDYSSFVTLLVSHSSNKSFALWIWPFLTNPQQTAITFNGPPLPGYESTSQHLCLSNLFIMIMITTLLLS